MFNIEFVRGDMKSALSEPHNIVIQKKWPTNTSFLKIPWVRH